MPASMPAEIGAASAVSLAADSRLFPSGVSAAGSALQNDDLVEIGFAM